MATYPPNNTIPKKGSDGYLWNWLGSSLKKFAAALSPYLGGSGDSGVKVYRALLTQSGGNAPTAIVMENTLGANITYTYGNTGYYVINISTVFPGSKTFAWIAFPGNANMGFSAAIYPQQNDVTMMGIETWNAAGSPNDDVLYDTPIEILIYP